MPICPHSHFALFCLNPGFNPDCQLISYLLMSLGVGMPADQRNRFDLFAIKSLATIFIKCQMHAYFENLLHSLYTFFPGKQRCWRWRLLLNIKCQLFLNCSCSSAVQFKLRPLPPLPAQPSATQCRLVQLSSSQPALHWAVHSRRNYTIFGQSKVDSRPVNLCL